MAVQIICDLIHVLEYVWRAARCLHTADDPAAEDQVAAWTLALLAGVRTHSLIDAVTAFELHPLGMA